MVLSILVVLAYPNYQTQMIENRRTDGQRILLEIMNEQQKFYSRNSTYTANLVAGGTVGLTYPDPNGDGSVPSDKGFYLVTAQACATLTINQCVVSNSCCRNLDKQAMVISLTTHEMKKRHWRNGKN